MTNNLLDVIEKAKNSKIVYEKQTRFYNKSMKPYIEDFFGKKFDNEDKLETPDIIIYITKPLSSQS